MLFSWTSWWYSRLSCGPDTSPDHQFVYPVHGNVSLQLARLPPHGVQLWGETFSCAQAPFTGLAFQAEPLHIYANTHIYLHILKQNIALGSLTSPCFFAVVKRSEHREIMEGDKRKKQRRRGKQGKRYPAPSYEWLRSEFNDEVKFPKQKKKESPSALHACMKKKRKSGQSVMH